MVPSPAADIRDRPFLRGEEIKELNFIKETDEYVFRRHYRSGLRSHVLELLRRQDVAAETAGVVVHGLRRYPRARPVRMLRLFRFRFSSLREAEEEVGRVKLVERYLGPKMFARSEEFLVSYFDGCHYHIMLCGLQDFIDGEILEPWGDLGSAYLESLYRQLPPGALAAAEWCQRVAAQVEEFVTRVKAMILEGGHVPDLAGVGNLIVTAAGEIKLVDINNIAPVSFSGEIFLDDRGFPVADKSIEALYRLERQLLGRLVSPGEPPYQPFLQPERMTAVSAIVRRFSPAVSPADNHPA